MGRQQETRQADDNCDRCNGERSIVVAIDPVGGDPIRGICPDCNGSGKK